MDIATYKAEFLRHYYQGRKRPRSAEDSAGPKSKYPERRYLEWSGRGPTAAELAGLAAGSLILAGLWYRNSQIPK